MSSHARRLLIWTRFASISVVVFPTSRTPPIDSIIDEPKKNMQNDKNRLVDATRETKKENANMYVVAPLNISLVRSKRQLQRVFTNSLLGETSTTNKTRDGIVVGRKPTQKNKSCQASLLWVTCQTCQTNEKCHTKCPTNATETCCKYGNDMNIKSNAHN